METYCRATNKRGYWKGKKCGNKAVSGGFCAVHQPMAASERDDWKHRAQKAEAENAELRKRAEEQEARADKNGAALTEINHHVVNATGFVGMPLADDVKNIIADRDRLKAEVERMRIQMSAGILFTCKYGHEYQCAIGGVPLQTQCRICGGFPVSQQWAIMPIEQQAQAGKDGA